MSELTPFLSTATRRDSDDTLINSPNASTDEYKIYSLDDEKHGNSTHSFHSSGSSAPSSPHLFQGKVHAPRSKVKLALLIVLGLAALISVSAWQAPDQVQDIVTKAQDVVAAGHGKATDLFRQAVDWTNWWQDGEDTGDEDIGSEDSGSELIVDTDQQNEAPQFDSSNLDETSSAPTSTYEPMAFNEPIQETETSSFEEISSIEETDPVVSDLPESTSEALESLLEPTSTAIQPESSPAASPASAATTTTASEPEYIEGPHPVYVLPDPPRKPKGGPEEKFLAYLPHSGYHNQRIELVNALSLASMLNRTLMVPPVWLGWPMTTLPYRALQDYWDDQMDQHYEAFQYKADHRLSKRQKKPALTADECKSYAKECRKTYKNTFLAWSYLTNMNLIEARVPIVDRFNMSEAYAKELAGVTSEDQVYLLEDLDKYYFHFHDRDTAKEPDMVTPLNPSESKYHYTVSVPQFRTATRDKKLVMLGSMFGSGRMYMQNRPNVRNHSYFHRSLAFSNHLLDTPANAIRDRMGGADAYAGIHARVGDGAFLMRAPENMEKTFTKLLDQLEVPAKAWPALVAAGKVRMAQLQAEKDAAAEAAAAASAAQRPRSPAAKHLSIRRSVPHLTKKAPVDLSDDDDIANLFSEWALPENAFEDDGAPLFAAEEGNLRKRQSTFLRPIKSRQETTLSSDLICRGEMHTDPDLLILNNPFYIATDSRAPLDEPALSFFWANLPCTFILADFDKTGPQNTGEPVHSLKTMEGAYNENDDVKLGRLFLPFMEAMVAAKALVTVGTDGSTFSSFASGTLHRAYHP